MKRFFQILFLFAFASVIAPMSVRSSNAPYLGWYARDAYGNSLVGATLNFYDHTTLLPRNVYSDEALSISLGAVLTSDGAGHFARFYMDPNNYKIIFKTAAGATVWTEDNVYGLKTNLSGIVSATSSGATAAITGTNTSSGYAVHAITTAGSSHALYVAADTSTPVKSAVHIVPQDNTPSAPTKGDLWFDTTTGRIRIYDGGEASELVFAAKAVCAATSAAGIGLTATGLTTGAGVYGTGGASSGIGVSGLGGATNGIGVYGEGPGTGAGVYGQCSGVGCNGVEGHGSTGVNGSGTANGISGTGSGSANGCSCYSGATGGYAGYLDAGNTLYAPLRLVPEINAPSIPQTGDIYYNSTTGHFYGRIVGAWQQLDN